MTAPDETATTTHPWAADGGVDVTIDRGVATVTLNRPPGNAWTPALGQTYFAALGSLSIDPDVRALVITGAGPDFCVGADGGSLDSIADAGGYQISDARPTYWLAMAIGKPVIAAVNGACFGVALQLASLCDVRFAGTSTKFSTAFVRRGLTAELGLTWLLPRLVGLGAATDLLLSGRLVRAPEAQAMGLVSRTVADDELVGTAQAYAQQLAERCSPASMAVIKRQIADDLLATLPESVARGDAHMERALASADFAEGVRSWREQRPPAFPPLDPALARFALPGEDPRADHGDDDVR